MRVTAVLFASSGFLAGQAVGNDMTVARGRLSARLLPPRHRRRPRRTTTGVTAAIGHISFGIENWNTERVREELKKRDGRKTSSRR